MEGILLDDKSSLANIFAGRTQRRAVEAAIWGMPAVNYDLMMQEMLTKTIGKINHVIFWGRPLNWHNQALTPSPDALYFMTFLNTKNVGPIVIEIPPADESGSLNANFANIWQRPLEDAGLLGIDRGAGAKLLMLPPEFKGNIPQGHIGLQPGTWGSVALIRSNLSSDTDAAIAQSIRYAMRLKVYPLSQRTTPDFTVFIDVQDVDFDPTIRYDISFFEGLNRIIQSEPWLARDGTMINLLETLGIEKGKPFAPDAATRDALLHGICQAHVELAAIYDCGLPPFFEGKHWTVPAPQELVKAVAADFNDLDHYPVDARGLVYHYAFMGIKRAGTGQFHMLSIKDKAGNNFDGGRDYRVTVPAHPPVDQYWSLTAYDRQTHAFIKKMPRASRASNTPKIKKNRDGSIDIFLGPAEPVGNESNWIPTHPTGDFELMFRLYGPTPAFFEKSWVLPDVELL